MNNAAWVGSLTNLQKHLGYTFTHKSWLQKALDHPSACPYNKEFERLEFLGDRILGLMMADMLLKMFPDANEGEIAKRHSFLVSKQVCQQIGQSLRLETHINMICDTKASSNMTSIIADVVEALLGAIYLDCGHATALSHVGPVVEKLWETALNTHDTVSHDPKSSLQEWVQRHRKHTPLYKLVKQTGPAHQPIFVYEVCIKGLAPFQGEGSNRKIAERAAAQKALDYLQSLH